jgi:O-acetylserine/cysteine efflux transporter
MSAPANPSSGGLPPPALKGGGLPPRDLAFAVLIAFLWGISFIAIKAGVTAAPPLFFTALRFSFVAFPAVLFIPRPKARLLDLAGYGLCIGVGQFGLLFAAIKYGMPAGLASLVLQMQALFTMGLAWLFLGQRVTRSQIAGALVALAGVGVIGFFRGGATPLGPFLSVLGAAGFWSLGNLFSIRAGRTNMFGFIVWSSLFAPLPLLALSLLLEDRGLILAALVHPSPVVWGNAVFLAYVATMIGFGLWSFLLSRHPAAQVTPFSLLVPVVGIGAATLVYHEPLSAGMLLGIGVVMTGLAIAIFGRR